MNYAGADTSSSRGDGAGVEFWNVLGIRDGERAGCPPGMTWRFVCLMVIQLFLTLVGWEVW